MSKFNPLQTVLLTAAILTTSFMSFMLEEGIVFLLNQNCYSMLTVHLEWKKSKAIFKLFSQLLYFKLFLLEYIQYALQHQCFLIFKESREVFTAYGSIQKEKHTHFKK